MYSPSTVAPQRNIRKLTGSGYSATLFESDPDRSIVLPASAYHVFLIPRDLLVWPVTVVCGHEERMLTLGQARSAAVYVPPFQQAAITVSASGQYILLQVLDCLYHRKLAEQMPYTEKRVTFCCRVIQSLSGASVEGLFTAVESTGPAATVSSPAGQYSAVTAVIKECLAEKPAGPESSRIAEEKIHQYMWQNLDQAISVDDLSVITHLSKYHFSRCYRSLTGASPAAFLRKLRVFKARHLLSTRQPQPRLADLALDCGFSDQPHLSRVFKQYTGMTPSAYLKLVESGKQQSV